MTSIPWRLPPCCRISTHILTKRMTSSFDWRERLNFISTHILTKRMTSGNAGWNNCCGISTHILTKRMTITYINQIIAQYISTHILTKRMTPEGMEDELPFKYFNSHPHEEDDWPRHTARPDPSTFQLTSSRRGWRIADAPVAPYVDISTHILTKRMTNSWKPNTKSLMHFNSHPHEEDDIQP